MVLWGSTYVVDGRDQFAAREQPASKSSHAISLIGVSAIKSRIINSAAATSLGRSVFLRPFPSSPWVISKSPPARQASWSAGPQTGHAAFISAVRASNRWRRRAAKCHCSETNQGDRMLYQNFCLQSISTCSKVNPRYNP